MAHDGDADVDHALYGRGHLASALELDAVAVRLHEHAAGAAYRLFGALLIAAEGHVADDEGVGRALDDGMDVVNHVVER